MTYLPSGYTVTIVYCVTKEVKRSVADCPANGTTDCAGKAGTVPRPEPSHLCTSTPPQRIGAWPLIIGSRGEAGPAAAPTASWRNGSPGRSSVARTRRSWGCWPGVPKASGALRTAA